MSTQPKLELVRDVVPHARPLTVAILGFGTVGRSVAEILSYNLDPRLRLTHIFNRNIDSKRVSWTPDELTWTADVNDVLTSDADIIIEAIGGLDPAEAWVRRALQRGTTVITANKQLIAHRGRELSQIARDYGAQLLFGASVAGGVPVLNGVKEGLAGDRLVGVSGILNGTCNYILSRMESANVSFDVALKEAQTFGFAEADPSADINGDDAAAKLAILAQVGLNAHVSPNSIRKTPVSSVEAIDFAYARQLNSTIRQVSRAQLDGRKLFAAVEPALVPQSSALARVEGSQNVVVASGKYSGNTAFLGHGAGGHPTAVAVISDVVAAADGRSHANWLAAIDAKPVRTSSDFTTPHYVRFILKDRPGIIATIASALAQRGINIDSILQKSGFAKAELPFVVTLEPCGASVLREALDELSRADFLVKAPVHFPILN
ncbi:MAG TPA: homoserine dehydrogenase [Terriglobales bacterium]|nr:homoserine dehydrogenase [Terriglobales bacterium]